MESKATVSNEAINLPALCTRSSVEELGASNARVARSNRAGCPNYDVVDKRLKSPDFRSGIRGFESRPRPHQPIAQQDRAPVS